MLVKFSLPLFAMVSAETSPDVVGAQVVDLKRAKQKVPRAAWKGDSFAEMSKVLTSKLSDSGHRIRPCEEWAVSELQDLQRSIFKLTEKELLSIYRKAADGRRQRFESLEELEEHWAAIDAAAMTDGSLSDMRRDGLCHEAVMWAVHHTTSSTLRRLLLDGLVLPSLPIVRHEAPVAVPLPSPVDHAHHIVHIEYAQQVSCQQCHTGKIILPEWQNASLPGPLPKDKVHPGRERVRDCTFTADPPCGPCEGLGGKRWGDDPEEMTPMECEVIHGPEVKATTRGRYPYLSKAGLTGETRNPLQVYPKPGDPKGTYPKLNGTVAFGDKDGMMRLRYDFFGLGSQISAQSMEQAKNMNVGATWGIFGGKCICSRSIAGNFHAESFDVEDPLDNLHLPAQQGGAAYLGRIRVTLDGDVAASQRVAIADHYMKWTFHFLVEADEKSPSFGLPLRLYGSGGVRMVYDSWHIADPVIAEPNIWTLPKGCKITVPECSNFPNATFQGTLKASAESERLVVI